VRPPEQAIFPMGSQVDLALRRGTGDIVLRVTIPEPRSRKQPYSELKAVTWARMANDLGYLKVSILPGQVGLDVSRAIDAAVAELESCDRLILDLRGHLGGGLGVLRLMSHLTPDKLPIGYTITRRRAESGYDKSKLPKLDRLPTYLPNFLGVASMVLTYAGRDPSILLVSEGLGPKKWHGRIVILVNE
jgi:carboxyl-terminal processing protease